ncbi:MAG: hypothetical protein N2749_02140 [Clostridia bacterium]|nr:hypothetical protein [Clostridia bacterium]
MDYKMFFQIELEISSEFLHNIYSRAMCSKIYRANVQDFYSDKQKESYQYGTTLQEYFENTIEYLNVRLESTIKKVEHLKDLLEIMMLCQATEQNISSFRHKMINISSKSNYYRIHINDLDSILAMDYLNNGEVKKNIPIVIQNDINLIEKIKKYIENCKNSLEIVDKLGLQMMDEVTNVDEKKSENIGIITGAHIDGTLVVDSLYPPGYVTDIYNENNTFFPNESWILTGMKIAMGNQGQIKVRKI